MKSFFQLLGRAFLAFQQNDPLRMAGATAFFASFALPAILIILIQVFGLILDPQTISRHLFESLTGIIGQNTVQQLRNTLRNVRSLAQSWWVAAAGFLFLIFVSTTLFKVIRDSLNQLWNIKVKAGPGIAIRLEQRVRSFLAILLVGVLFLAVLLAEGVITIFRQYISETVPDSALLLNGMLNQVVSLVVVTAWFMMVFKFLPDGRPVWRVALAGGLFTGVLFTFGKLLIRWLLSYSNMHSIYGASTSIVLLLLFVFYSSFIFYYGACFTRELAEHRHRPIEPGKHAVNYRLELVEMNGH